MKITSQERSKLVSVWILACFLNGLLGLFGILAWRAQSTVVHPMPLQLRDSFLLLFPASGIALLVWAIRETVLWKTYGPTFFVSDVEIIPWAGKLNGRILFSGPLPAAMGRQFRLTLACQYQCDKNSAIVWRDVRLVDILAEAVPVSFSLPSETKPNPSVLPSQMILNLKVREVGGGFRSFAAEYLLPFEGSPNDDPFAERKRNFERRRSEV